MSDWKRVRSLRGGVSKIEKNARLRVYKMAKRFGDGCFGWGCCIWIDDELECDWHGYKTMRKARLECDAELKLLAESGKIK